MLRVSENKQLQKIWQSEEGVRNEYRKFSDWINLIVDGYASSIHGEEE